MTDSDHDDKKTVIGKDEPKRSLLSSSNSL